MPWHIVPKSSQCPASRPWAVVLDTTGKAVGCHPTEAAAAAHLAALNANVKGVEMGKKQEFVEDSPVPSASYVAPEVRTITVPPNVTTTMTIETAPAEREVEERWDGDAAMGKCKTAGDFRSIAFELANDSAKDSAAHWALPHHATPGGPADAGGVSAALGRLNQTGATVMSKASIETHLRRHQGSSKSADPFPRDSLYRGVWPADLELRDADGFPGPVMFGHFAVYNQWTRIESIFEGEFLERILPGAFAKTFADDRDSIRALFQHGRDAYVGSKVLGPIEVLREDEKGAYYEVPLLDTSYNRDLEPGLRAGLYGASFRFRVMREEVDEDPGRSEYNPDGLPERSIKAAEVHEFGPVTFPAYVGASAGVRSLSDEFVLGAFVRDRERLREILRYLDRSDREDMIDDQKDDRRDDGDIGRASGPAASPPSAGDLDRASGPAASPKVRDYLSEQEVGPSWIL